MKVPKLGNIRIGGELIGFRDFTTKDPIMEAGWSLVSDNACPTNPLVMHQQIAVTHLGEFVTNTVV
jgi:hypothetical protein